MTGRVSVLEHHMLTTKACKAPDVGSVSAAKNVPSGRDSLSPAGLLPSFSLLSQP